MLVIFTVSCCSLVEPWFWLLAVPYQHICSYPPHVEIVSYWQSEVTQCLGNMEQRWCKNGDMDDKNQSILAAAMWMTCAPLDTTGVIVSRSLTVTCPHLLTLKYRRTAVIISLSTGKYTFS
jgi:hypothetical protein